MHPTPRPAAWPLATAALVAFAALLVACGGSNDHEPLSRATSQQLITPTLLDDDGQPQRALADAEPADPSVRTLTGHYATANQADALQAALGSGAINAHVGRGYNDDARDAKDARDARDARVAKVIATAVQDVRNKQAAGGLDRRAVVLLRADDLRLGAAVAERLEDEGYERVFLVTTR